MNKEALEKQAEEVFAFHKNAKLLYATNDGQFFLESSKNMADSHAKEIKSEVIIINRDGDPQIDQYIKLPIEELESQAESNGMVLIPKDEYEFVKTNQTRSKLLETITEDEILVLAENRDIELTENGKTELLLELEAQLNSED